MSIEEAIENVNENGIESNPEKKIEQGGKSDEGIDVQGGDNHENEKGDSVDEKVSKLEEMEKRLDEKIKTLKDLEQKEALKGRSQVVKVESKEDKIKRECNEFLKNTGLSI